ncbi:MAG: DNA-binding transcriptional repressor MarR [Syntrophorhabdus sp. PtaU1.Bin153]|nr:MAG: DNA-binding transcriptional repressor MarR [Syntrophorhabdus sp. PtaU1.Bin153]
MQQFIKTMRIIERKLGDLLKNEPICCGVTMAQCHVLLATEEKGRTSVTELAAELELDKSTLSRTIDGLVAVGLVSRETDVANRRSQHVCLTPQGEKIVTCINEQWNGYCESLFDLIPEAKHSAVTEGLAVLANALLSSGRCCDAKISGKKQENQEGKGSR